MVELDKQQQPRWKRMMQRDSFWISVLAVLPSFLMSLICYIILNQFNIVSNNIILEYNDNLYTNQINSSILQNYALSVSFNSQIQFISWRIYIINKLWKQILEGNVTKNLNHRPSLISLEKTFQNTEDPTLLNLFRKSSTLTSTWFNPNHIEFEELDLNSQDQFLKASYLDSLWRSVKNENMRDDNDQYNQKLRIKDILLGFEQDGSLYLTGLNTTYAGFKPPTYCRPNKYNMDVRCRYYYQPTMDDISIKVFSPDIFYSQFGNPFLASIFCQKTDFRNAGGEYQKYSVLCISLDLTLIPTFMNNFGSNSKFQMFVDPFKQIMIYHSEKQIGRNQVTTLEEYELQWMDSKKQAQIFSDNVKNFTSDIILSKTSNITMGQLLIKNIPKNQKTFNYIRNGTECFVIMNRIVLYDLIPTLEDQKKVGAKYFEKNAFILFDVLTKEQLTTQSRKLIEKVEEIQFFFKIATSVFIIIAIIVEIFYARKISSDFEKPIVLLTNILKSIQQEQDNVHLKKDSIQTTKNYKRNNSSLNKTYLERVESQKLPLSPKSPLYSISPRSKVREDQVIKRESEIVKREETKMNNTMSTNQMMDDQFIMNQFEFGQEAWEENMADICLSSETQSLYDSFQKLFQTLRFTTQNIFGTNESESLLNFSCQIEHFKQFKNYRALGVCFNNMGNIHYNCGRYNEALENYHHALIYAQYELQFYSEAYDHSKDAQCINQLSFGNFINCQSGHNSLQKQKATKNSDQSHFQSPQHNTCQYLNLNFQGNPRNKDKRIALMQVLNIESFKNFTSCEKIRNHNFNRRAESESLWWNIFNRKFNYSQALAAFLKDPLNKNIQLWEEMEKVLHELLAISESEYLPSCYKRDMMILYMLSNALLQQNKIQQFVQCLSLYKQIFHLYKDAKQSAKSQNLLFDSQNKIEKNRHQSIQFNQTSVNKNQMYNNKNSSSRELIFFENTPKHKDYLKSKPVFYQNLDQSPTHTPIKNQFINQPKSRFFQSTSLQTLQPSTNFKQHDILKKNNNRSNSLTSENQFPNLDEDQQKDLVDIKYNEQEEALSHTSRKVSIDLNLIPKAHEFGLEGKQNKIKEKSQSYQFSLEKRKSSIQSDQSLKSKGNQKKLVYSQNPSPQLLHSTNQNQKQPSSPQTQIIQNKDLNISIQMQLNKKVSSHEQTSILRNKHINTAEHNVYALKKKQDESQVKVILDLEKTSQYKFSLDIFEQYFTLQLSSLQNKLGNFHLSAEILTEQLERSYVYLPHLKQQILKKLSNIFIKSRIYNPQLFQMCQKYEQLQNTNFRVCLISNSHSAFAKQISQSLCQNIISDVLIKSEDQFALFTYSHEEGIYQHLLSLTSKHILKKQWYHFSRLIFEAFLHQRGSQNYLEETEQISNYPRSKQLKKMNNKSSIQPSQNYLYNKYNTQTQNRIQMQKANDMTHLFLDKSLVEEVEYMPQINLNYDLNDKQRISLPQTNSNQFIVRNCNQEVKENCELQHHFNLDQGLVKYKSNNQINQNIIYPFTNPLNHQQRVDLKYPLFSCSSNQNLLNDQQQDFFNTDINKLINVQQNEDYYEDIDEPMTSNRAYSKIENTNLNNTNYDIQISTKIQQKSSKQNSNLNKNNNNLIQQQKDQINLKFSQISNKINIHFDNKSDTIHQINQKSLTKNDNLSSSLIKNNNEPQSALKENIYKEDIHQQLLFEKMCPKFSTLNSYDENETDSFQQQLQGQKQQNSTIDKQYQKLQKLNKVIFSPKQKKQEMIFHLGIHIALKRAVLDSPQKIAFHSTHQNNIKQQQQCKIKNIKNVFSQHDYQQKQNFPLQKTFLIYVTDQEFNISNYHMYQELCNLLENMSIELLILIKNQYQSTIEDSIIKNINNNKQTIQYFNCRSKLLQYIYNSRDVINHKLYPTIVEQFQTHFLFVFIL